MVRDSLSIKKQKVYYSYREITFPSLTGKVYASEPVLFTCTAFWRVHGSMPAIIMMSIGGITSQCGFSLLILTNLKSERCQSGLQPCS